MGEAPAKSGGWHFTTHGTWSPSMRRRWVGDRAVRESRSDLDTILAKPIRSCSQCGCLGRVVAESVTCHPSPSLQGPCLREDPAPNLAPAMGGALMPTLIASRAIGPTPASMFGPRCGRARFSVSKPLASCGTLQCRSGAATSPSFKNAESERTEPRCCRARLGTSQVDFPDTF